MPQWEYLVVRVEYHTFRENVTVRAVNDQELRDRDTPLPAFLNQLGTDNWELVCTLGYRTGINYNELLFKRPKP